MIFGLKGSETFGLGDLAGFDLHRQGPSLVFAKKLHFSLSLPPTSRLPPEGVELLLAAILGHIGEVVCGESLLNFSGLRAGVPQVSPQGLKSGNAVAASRRWGGRASPQESDGGGAPSLPPKKGALRALVRQHIRFNW